MKIGISLSGGGTRAAVFHLGVLLRLAQCDIFDRIVRLSTVSGGSLVTALIFTHGKAKPLWPDAKDYKSVTYPALRKLLTSTDLLSVSAILGHPGLIRFLPSQRSLAVSRLLEAQWGINGALADLPESPHWIINTTCIETGKNWRFSRTEMGDWIFGRHYNPNFRIAEAAAASAAVPYALGSMLFRLPQKGWFETNPATSEPIKQKEPPHNTVHLWDGGAYENLGVEALYKPGRNTFLCDDVIVSDASGFVPTTGTKGGLAALFSGGLMTPRLFDISSDQIRSLRSRMFIDAVSRGQIKGSLIRMGNSAKTIFKKAGAPLAEENTVGCLSDKDASRAWKTQTHLKAFSEEHFDLIARHGFECADATLVAHRKDIVANSIPWPMQ